jgi:copper chaperone CopZ
LPIVRSIEMTTDTTAVDFAGDQATAEFEVTGMHCGSCVALITETLLERHGVTSATVDLDAARAVVGYDPAQVGTDDLRTLITDSGYPATAVV